MMCKTRFPSGAEYTQEDVLGALVYWDMGRMMIYTCLIRSRNEHG